MLKIPVETWNRLFEFKDGFKEWPYPASLHGSVSILLDVVQSAKDMGGTVHLGRSRDGNYYRSEDPIVGRLVFKDGIVNPVGDKKSKK